MKQGFSNFMQLTTGYNENIRMLLLKEKKKLKDILPKLL